MLAQRLTGNRKKKMPWLGTVLLEILIIILGVLISLWISNSFKNGQDRKMERAYLDNLYQDLLADREKLADNLLQRKAQLAAARQMIRALSDSSNPANNAVFTTGLQELIVTIHFNPTLTTFRTLESTGHLELIRNDSIVNGMIELYTNSYAAILHNNEDLARFRDNFLLPFTISTFDFRAAFSAGDDAMALPARELSLLSNQLIYVSISLQSSSAAYEANLKSIDELLRIVEEEAT